MASCISWGRRDDIIKSGGEKVPPREVEEVLHHAPGVREAAVVGVPDRILGEAVQAHVALGAGYDQDPSALRRYCAQRLEDYMVPRGVIFDAELPRTENGKLDRPALTTRVRSLGPQMTGLQEVQALERRYAMPTYTRAPVEFVRGEGARLWDAEGKEYLDFFAGLSVHNAGHCHPRIVAAITHQAARFNGSSNLFLSEPALRVAERISQSSLGGKVFLSNSGAEAAECAIKLARKHAHSRGIEKPEVVSLDGGFHGRTLGALAATPKLADEGRFGPLPRGFKAVPRDDASALRGAVGPDTAAVMIEPIQGEAGIFPVSDEVLIAAREACDETGALLVLDEVQTGMGRTGSLWAYEQLPVTPDLMTTAKALGGGLPVGAVVVTPQLGETFEPGDHGTTFGGGPVAASAALAALDVIDDETLLSNVRERGTQLIGGLTAIDGVAEVRGRGLMIGLTLADGIDAPTVRDRCLEEGLVLNCPGPGMLRLLPPLVVGPANVEEGLAVLSQAISK